MPRAFTPYSMMQRRTRDGEVINYSYEMDKSPKVEQNKPEVWDLLGHPSEKFNYKVKYITPSTAHVLLEDIVPSAWGEVFNKKMEWSKLSSLQIYKSWELTVSVMP